MKFRDKCSRTVPLWHPSTGNICCWALYFFAYSISPSRFLLVRRKICQADGESWRMTGLPRCLQQSCFGSHADSECSAQQSAFWLAQIDRNVSTFPCNRGPARLIHLVKPLHHALVSR